MRTNCNNVFRLMAACLFMAFSLLVVCSFRYEGSGSAEAENQSFDVEPQVMLNQRETTDHGNSFEKKPDNLNEAVEEAQRPTLASSQSSYVFNEADDGEVRPRIEMDEDSLYEPQSVLLSIAPGTTVEEVNELIAQTDSIENHAVTAEQLQNGLLVLEVAQMFSVEDAINDLAASDVTEYVQPDYIYYALGSSAHKLCDHMANLTDGRIVDEMSEPSPTGEGDDNSNISDYHDLEFDRSLSTADDMPDDELDRDTSESSQPDQMAEDSSNEDHMHGHGETIEYSGSLDEQGPQTEKSSLADELASLVPNDTFVGEQWALTRMRVFEAWAYATCDDQVGVAILDEGPDSSHADLVDTLRDSYDIHAKTGEPSLLLEHGTHVSGIVGATVNNDNGIAGVSHNAGMVLLNVFYRRTYNNDVKYVTNTSTLVDAYQYLISNKDTLGVRVVNLSLGVKKSSKSTYSDDALVSCINDAFDNGIVSVAASGNSDLGTPPYYEYPGDAQNVVSVMNLNQVPSGVDISATSNFNVNGQTSKNICAPGTNIKSTTIDNGYSILSGTSMAAPHVSGVLALEFAANPTLTAQEAVNILYGTARDLGDEGWDEKYGWGEVDACAAVKAAREGSHTSLPDISDHEIPEPQVEGPTRIPVGASATFKVTNGTLSIKEGKAAATLDGTTLTGVEEGMVTLSVLDNAGVEQASRNVVVYASTGCWVISPVEDTAYALDVKGGSVLNSANTQLYACNGKNNQVWKLELQRDGSFVVRSGKSGKVLDVSGASKKAGANVIQYTPSGKPWQKWMMVANPDNSVMLINVNSSMALELEKNAANSVNVRQGVSTGVGAQRWVLRSVTADIGPIWDGVYKVSSSLNKSYVLDVKGASKSNGGNVQLYRCNGNANQRWRFEYLGKGVYKIVNSNSGKVLDVARGTLKNSVNISQYTWNGGSNQRWELEAFSDGSYGIMRAGTNWAVDVKGAKARNSRNVHQYQRKANAAQRWFLTQY